MCIIFEITISMEAGRTNMSEVLPVLPTMALLSKTNFSNRMHFNLSLEVSQIYIIRQKKLGKRWGLEICRNLQEKLEKMFLVQLISTCPHFYVLKSFHDSVAYGKPLTLNLCLSLYQIFLLTFKIENHYDAPKFSKLTLLTLFLHFFVSVLFFTEKCVKDVQGKRS